MHHNNIKQYYLEEEYPIISIISMKNTGKSILVKHITKEFRINNKFDICYCFCNTSKLNNDYNYLPNKYIHNEVDENLIQKIMYTQENKILNNNDFKKILIIFDDVLGDSNFNLRKSSTLKTLFTQNRHYKISIITSIQQLTNSIPPYVRNNISSFFFSQNNKNNIETIYNEIYFPGTFSEFQKLVYSICNNYYFMIFTKNTYKNSLQKIKASLNKSLKIRY